MPFDVCVRSDYSAENFRGWRGLSTGVLYEALAAHVVIAKYFECQPLYRLAERYVRDGVALDHARFADWVGCAVGWLRPLPLA